MGHRPHELSRRIARKLRVRVEGDDVSDVREHFGIADNEGESVAAPPRRSAFSSASFPRFLS